MRATGVGIHESTTHAQGAPVPHADQFFNSPAVVDIVVRSLVFIVVIFVVIPTVVSTIVVISVIVGPWIIRECGVVVRNSWRASLVPADISKFSDVKNPHIYSCSSPQGELIDL